MSFTAWVNWSMLGRQRIVEPWTRVQPMRLRQAQERARGKRRVLAPVSAPFPAEPNFQWAGYPR